MIAKIKIVFKRVLKISLWISTSLVLLLVCLIFLINVPAVQNKLINKAIDYLERKTGAEVKLKKINLSFPKAIALEELLIKDLSHDTLLSAGKIKIDVSLYHLLHKEVFLNTVLISRTSVNLKRKQSDSLFNFNFLITAFSGAGKKDTARPQKETTIHIGHVKLDKINFTFKDYPSGLVTGYYVESLEINPQSLLPGKQEFKVHSIYIDGLIGQLEQFKSSKQSKTPDTTQQLPFISAETIVIKNSRFIYSDKVIKQSVSADIGKLLIDKSEVDLNKQQIKAAGFYLAETNGRVNLTEKSEENPKSIPQKINTGIEKGWTILVDKIKLERNDLGYNIINAPRRENAFDYKHINYKNVSLTAKNFLYSIEKLTVSVSAFSARDPRSFEVKHFSADFVMTPKMMSATNISLQTKKTTFAGEGLLRFNQLSTIGDSLSNLIVKASIDKSKIYPAEVAYFVPQLRAMPFFSNSPVTHMKGKISGSIGNLCITGLETKTGNNTFASLTATITGLPAFQKSSFSIPFLRVSTSSRDLQLITGKSNINNTIFFPNEVSIDAHFKGTIKDFISTASIKSDFGDINLNGSIDSYEHFEGELQTNNFNLGNLLHNTKMFGPLTLHTVFKGQGLDTQSFNANVNLKAEQLYLAKYMYHNVSLNGYIAKKIFSGNIQISDSNIAMKVNGLINLNKGQEQYKVNMNLEGADLRKLKLSEQDLKIGFLAASDIKGRDMNTINGKAGITRIIVASKGKKYILDSLIFAMINESGNSEVNLSSSIIGISYKGTFAPGDLVKKLKYTINSYFPIDNQLKEEQSLQAPQQFSFEIKINNHPILQEVFFPELKEFDPGNITGSFNSEKNKLELNASVNRLVYSSLDLNGLNFSVSSDENKLQYDLNGTSISNSRVKFENVVLSGKLENKSAFTTLSSIGENGDKKLLINTVVTPSDENYKVEISPPGIYLMNQEWSVAEDNYLLLGKEGFLFHNLLLTKTGSEISANTPSGKPAGDIILEVKNFHLEDISGIAEKDTAIIKGTVNGTTILKKINQAYAFESDLSIRELFIHAIPVGDLTLKAASEAENIYTLNLSLRGEGNDILAKGSYSPKKTGQELDLSVFLQPLTAQSLEAFSFGQLYDASGILTGKFTLKGKTLSPEVNGKLNFENFGVTPAYLNSRLFIKSETIDIQPNGLDFNSFTILDKNDNPAVINGNISMKQFRDFKFALTLNTTNFLLLNTTQKNNEQYFGTLVIDSRIRVKGTLEYPVITSSVKLKKGSYFTFALTEKKLSTHRGENVLLFTDSAKFNPILTRNEKKEKKKSTLKNFDISSTVEIDKKATVRLMLDPGTNDSLVVRGEAALSFGLDPSGKISLTGVYNLTDGNYVVSLENVIKKKFRIEPGSTITWNGDPLDALVNLNASYFVRTSPVDLVAGQLTTTELASYRQRYGFQVLLKLRGPLMAPAISFEIQLQQSEKGAVGGTINGKLEQLNDNPSSLNKQVFALLVLNRFVQENPLETETNASENAARTTVGRFLSAQLNQFSSKFVPGVDVNFDVQSYDDYSSGKSQGRTQVGVGVSKQLFDERLSVQVGGAVDVEGERARQNNANDITGDVIIEYKLTKDGRYRLKGFRNNQYQGALEGQIIQTGAGLLYVRDFNEWLQLFQKEKKENLNDEQIIHAWDTK